MFPPFQPSAKPASATIDFRRKPTDHIAGRVELRPLEMPLPVLDSHGEARGARPCS